MDSNANFFFLVKQKCKEFLAFTFLEVRFLVDSSSCSNTRSLTNATVMLVPYFFDYRPRPRIVAAAKRGTRMHAHTCTRMRIILTTVTGLTLGLFVLYNSFPWLTAELRGCVYYCQHLTVVAVSLVRTPPSNSSHTETCSE